MAMKWSMLKGLLSATCILGSLPSLAQTQNESDSSILMRRPLPFARSTDSQSSCQETGTCPDDGSEEPQNPECDPLVETCDDPGEEDPGEENPGEEEPVEEYPEDPGEDQMVMWIASAWEGQAVCGGATNLTRQVSCMQYTIDYEDNYPGCGDGYETQCDPDNPYPSSSDNPKVYDVNIPPGMLLLGGHQVSDSLCFAYGVNSRPASSYTGQGGGCNYEVHEDENDIQWTMPPYGRGTLTCSPSVVGKSSLKCYNTNTGQYVPYEMCKINPIAGGVAIYKGGTTIYGNTSGCAYEWQESVTSGRCDGADYKQGYTHYCARVYPSNQYYTDDLYSYAEEGYCEQPKPDDTERTTKSCYYKFGSVTTYRETCSGAQTMQMEGYYHFGGVEACDASGATCCATFNVFDQNHQNGRTLVVGKTGGIVSSPMTYYTTCPDTGTGTCFIENFGASEKRWMSYCPYGPC